MIVWTLVWVPLTLCVLSYKYVSQGCLKLHAYVSNCTYMCPVICRWLDLDIGTSGCIRVSRLYISQMAHVSLKLCMCLRQQIYRCFKWTVTQGTNMKEIRLWFFQTLLLGKGLSHPWAPRKLMKSGYDNQKIKIPYYFEYKTPLNFLMWVLGKNWKGAHSSNLRCISIFQQGKNV
jgi:hypothetical protein